MGRPSLKNMVEGTNTVVSKRIHSFCKIKMDFGRTKLVLSRRSTWLLALITCFIFLAYLMLSANKKKGGQKHYVYTYFDEIGFGAGELELVNLWKKSWSAYGWTPIVLDQSVAKNHPKFREYARIFASYPSKNQAVYELACYFRYIAMVIVGGGFMSDIDVMNYGFRYPKNWDWSFTTHQSFIPSLVSASKEEYQRVLDLMAYNATELGVGLVDNQKKRYMSDMIMLGTFMYHKWTKGDECLVGKESNRLLQHWSHQSMYDAGFKDTTARAKFIQESRIDPYWNP
jgi:hypothetical protein